MVLYLLGQRKTFENLQKANTFCLKNVASNVQLSLVFNSFETWLIDRQDQGVKRLLGGWGKKLAKVSESLKKGE